MPNNIVYIFFVYCIKITSRVIINDHTLLFYINIHHILFSRFNESGTGKLTLEELKKMMEKLGAPQTHLGLKAMIQVIQL